MRSTQERASKLRAAFPYNEKNINRLNFLIFYSGNFFPDRYLDYFRNECEALNKTQKPKTFNGAEVRHHPSFIFRKDSKDIIKYKKTR